MHCALAVTMVSRCMRIAVAIWVGGFGGLHDTAESYMQGLRTGKYT